MGQMATRLQALVIVSDANKSALAPTEDAALPTMYLYLALA